MAITEKVEVADPDPTSRLRQLLEEAGAALIGFADLACLEMTITGEFPFGICFALRRNARAVDDLPDDEAWLRSSAELSTKARRVYHAAKEFIHSQGYRYAKITSSVPPDKLPGMGEEVPQKTLATLSGLGWIGKSALLITPEHGPRVRIGTLVTDMPLSVDSPITQSGCGECSACVDACPVQAIRGESWSQGMKRCELLRVNKCHDHLWSTMTTLGRRQTCALCLKVCPFGKKALQ